MSVLDKVLRAIFILSLLGMFASGMYSLTLLGDERLYYNIQMYNTVWALLVTAGISGVVIHLTNPNA